MEGSGRATYVLFIYLSLSLILFFLDSEGKRQEKE